MGNNNLLCISFFILSTLHCTHTFFLSFMLFPDLHAWLYIRQSLFKIWILVLQYILFSSCDFLNNAYQLTANKLWPTRANKTQQTRKLNFSSGSNNRLRFLQSFASPLQTKVSPFFFVHITEIMDQMSITIMIILEEIDQNCKSAFTHHLTMQHCITVRR